MSPNPIATAKKRLTIRHRSRLAASLSLLLAGGSLFGACEMRFRDAFVAASQDFLFTLLDADTIVGLILDDSGAGTDDSSTSP